ncbi:hypothetical protein MSMTP_2948 [Methanosarcina sp. MTP4]|uniref:hypothetical protein n=1 Tax=Methanosarcina sp. MTP4 TaxID=1434100 RepID=UPI000616137D|nr:hypothetical protein [Methanosarcina sp. MTP4]AKB26417.1 hypothetical protein MSMTP_2948 [Methanosarcina sp. MTP4]
MQEKEEDELDVYINSEKGPSEAEAIKKDHVMMGKVALSSERRKLVRIVGFSGIKKEELKEKSGLSDFMYKYHMDLLLKEGILKDEGGKYHLTDPQGITVHESGLRI